MIKYSKNRKFVKTILMYSVHCTLYIPASFAWLTRIIFCMELLTGCREFRTSWQLSCCYMTDIEIGDNLKQCYWLQFLLAFVGYNNLEQSLLIKRYGSIQLPLFNLPILNLICFISFRLAIWLFNRLKPLARQAVTW